MRNSKFALEKVIGPGKVESLSGEEAWLALALPGHLLAADPIVSHVAVAFEAELNQAINHFWKR